MALKYYTREEKRLKLKVKKIWGLILMFVEVTGKKLVVGIFAQKGGVEEGVLFAPHPE